MFNLTFYPMYKKILLGLVLMVIGFTSSLTAETLTVYDGGNDNNYVPVYGFYADAYLKAEFVMNSNELVPMTGGTISGMKWYLSSPASGAWGGIFQIFIKEVNFTTIDAFMGMNGATIVYEGPLDATGEELAIDFADSFGYQGGNLLVGVYCIEKGNFKSASFTGKYVEGAAVQGYNYSFQDAIEPTQRDFLPKTTFTYEPATGVVYYKPTNLQASNITPNSATITWTPGGEETSWNVEYKMHSEEEWIPAGSVSTPSIDLDVLHNATTYDVRVQSDYGDGNLSGWTDMSFTTALCDVDDMGEITYTLTDSYGDGWNGNKIQIVHHNTGLLIAELTIVTGAEATGTVSLCYGEDYDVVWVAGSYVGETAAEIVDDNGNVIYSHPQGSSLTAGVLSTFRFSRVNCPRPTNLTASNVVYDGATLTWTPGNEEQDLWQVVCGTGDFNPDDAEPVTVNGEPTLQLTGLEENTTYKAYVRSMCTDDEMSIWSDVCTFTTPLRFALPTDLAVGKITAKSAEASWTGEGESYNLRYRVKTDMSESFEGTELPSGWTFNNGWQVMQISSYNMSGTPLVAADGEYCMADASLNEQTNSPLGVDNWLISPKVKLGGTLEFYAADLGTNYVENYSVYVSTSGTDAADFVAIEENINTSGVLNQWDKKEFDLSAFAGQEGYVAIRHHDAQGYYLFIDAVAINGVDADAEWTVMEGVTSPFTMEPLQDGTTYEVQVQTVYADGASAWTESEVFTTLRLDAAPSDLEVIDVTATTATANWIGSQDTYNLRYRKAAINKGIEEDFQGIATGNLPEGWTTIDADGDGQNWYVWNLTLVDGTVQTTLSSNSYIQGGGALTPDNWVITPQALIGPEVSFVAWGQDPSYAEEVFRVYVSTTGTDVADFVPVSEDIEATGTKTTYTFNLSEYAGQQGYIAIRHYNVTDKYILNVVDFYMASPEDEPAGDWIEINNVTPAYTIEGLTPETTYEVQVQGVVSRATSNWTESVFFTTTEYVEPAQTAAPEIISTPGEEFYTFTAQVKEGDPDAVVTLYMIDEDGNRVEVPNPFTVTITEEAQTIQFVAVAHIPGQTDGEVSLTAEIPAGTATGIDEMTNGKQVASVRYFNALGQEMQQANGVTIIVTTYTDGTSSTVKVLK